MVTTAPAGLPRPPDQAQLEPDKELKSPEQETSSKSSHRSSKLNSTEVSTGATSHGRLDWDQGKKILTKSDNGEKDLPHQEPQASKKSDLIDNEKIWYQTRPNSEVARDTEMIENNGSPTGTSHIWLEKVSPTEQAQERIDSEENAEHSLNSQKYKGKQQMHEHHTLGDQEENKNAGKYSNLYNPNPGNKQVSDGSIDVQMHSKTHEQNGAGLKSLTQGRDQPNRGVHRAQYSQQNNFPKVSNNFSKPSLNHQRTRPLSQPTNSNDSNKQTPEIQPNQNLKQDHNTEPAPYTVIQSYAARLRLNQARQEVPLEISKPKFTTKQGFPAVIFNKDDFMIKLAANCKYTLIGKFSNTMPKVELIRKNFILQTQLTGGVKIAHFNARHVYIDLDNELDYVTVWTKQRMHIEGQLMRIQTWTPNFKPEEETPIVPIWIILPELPWHCYNKAFVNELLAPIGKVLYFDTASIQKTRGSVAKVKVQVDLTKERPSHIWIGLDEEDITQGRWQSVQYEGVPDYCFYCKHQGHTEDVCTVKQRDEDYKKRKEHEADKKNTYKVEPEKEEQDQALSKQEINKQQEIHLHNEVSPSYDPQQQTQNEHGKAQAEQWHTHRRRNGKNLNTNQTNKVSKEVTIQSKKAGDHQQTKISGMTTTNIPVQNNFLGLELQDHSKTELNETNMSKGATSNEDGNDSQTEGNKQQSLTAGTFTNYNQNDKDSLIEVNNNGKNVTDKSTEASNIDKIIEARGPEVNNVVENVETRGPGIDLSTLGNVDPNVQDRFPNPHSQLSNSVEITPIPRNPSCVVIDEFSGGEDGLEENNLQEGDPGGGNLTHVLHEKPYVDPNMDHRAPATSLDHHQTNTLLSCTQAHIAITPNQNIKLGAKAKDLGSYASTSKVDSKAKKNSLSKKRRDALKRRIEEEIIALSYDQPQPPIVDDDLDEYRVINSEDEVYDEINENSIGTSNPNSNGMEKEIQQVSQEQGLSPRGFHQHSTIKPKKYNHTNSVPINRPNTRLQSSKARK